MLGILFASEMKYSRCFCKTSLRSHLHWFHFYYSIFMLFCFLSTVYKTIHDIFIFITVFTTKPFHGTHHSVTELPLGKQDRRASSSSMLSHDAISLNKNRATDFWVAQLVKHLILGFISDHDLKILRSTPCQAPVLEILSAPLPSLLMLFLSVSQKKTRQKRTNPKTNKKTKRRAAELTFLLKLAGLKVSM